MTSDDRLIETSTLNYADMPRANELCERLGLSKGGPYLAELLTFAGPWCRLGVDITTHQAVGIVLASPGSMHTDSARSRPWDDDQVLDEPDSIIVHDVMAVDDEAALMLLSQTASRASGAGYEAICFVENQTTQWWIDLIEAELLSRHHGQLRRGVLDVPELGAVGHWVDFE